MLPDIAPAETELLFEPLAATETNTKDGFDGIDFCYDNLMLSVNQLKQITQFRDSLRSCKSDEDKFQLCLDTRDALLSQRIQFNCFIASIEALMSAECKKYKKKKLVWSEREGLERDKAWERFVGVALNGQKEITKRLPCLRKISSVWGKDKIQHYQWAFAGKKYCDVLSSASSQVPNWPEALIKLNQLILRRIQMRRRQSLVFSINPISQIDLQNLKKWRDQDPYIKINDPDRVYLHYQRLQLKDIPDGYGFDKYGLIVRDEFASISVRETTLFSEAEETSICPSTSSTNHRTMSTFPEEDRENAFYLFPTVDSVISFNRAESTSEDCGLSSPVSLSSRMASSENETRELDEIKRLRIQIQELKRSGRNKDNQIIKLHAELKTVKEDLEEKQLETESNKRVIEEKDQDLSNLRTELQQVSNQINLRVQMQELEQDGGNKDDQIAKLHTELEVVKRDLEQKALQHNELLTKNSQLCTEIESQARQRESDTNTIGERDRELSVLRAELEQLSNKIELLQREVLEMDSLRDAFKRGLEEKESIIAALNHQLDDDNNYQLLSEVLTSISRDSSVDLSLLPQFPLLIHFITPEVGCISFSIPRQRVKGAVLLIHENLKNSNYRIWASTFGSPGKLLVYTDNAEYMTAASSQFSDLHVLTSNSLSLSLRRWLYFRAETFQQAKRPCNRAEQLLNQK